MLVVAPEPAKPKPLEMPPEVHAGVKAVSSRTRLAQKDVVGLVMGWFIRSDIGVQSAILGDVPDIYRADFARMILDKMANAGAEAEGSGGSPVDKLGAELAGRKGRRVSRSRNPKPKSEAG